MQASNNTKLTVRETEEGDGNAEQRDSKLPAAAFCIRSLIQAPLLPFGVTDRWPDSAVNGQERQFYK